MTAQLRLLQSLLDNVRYGARCALCTVVGTRGSTPQTAGAMLLLHENGQIEGTVGGGCVEAELRREALRLLNSSESGLLTFVLDHDYGWDDGLICGGRLDIAVVTLSQQSQTEPIRKAVEAIVRQETARLPLCVPHEGKTVEYQVNIEPTPTLLIAGAGHVGAAVAKLAVDLDFRVVVFDDRADLLSASRLQPPIESAAGDIQSCLRQWPIDKNTYVVVVTRGHSHDEQALHAVVDSPARYIGMIGSRRKIRLIFDDLENLGVSRSSLEEVHTPIGLKIGAVTVPEIAVSIAAELVQDRRVDSLRAVEGPFDVDQATP
jgi:xanthine dehydrogenase accessory factor